VDLLISNLQGSSRGKESRKTIENPRKVKNKA